MAVRRTRRRKFPRLSVNYLAILLDAGWDFFSLLTGTVYDNLEGLQEEWSSQEIREATLDHCRESKREKPWAQLVFDEGENPHDAHFMREYIA